MKTNLEKYTITNKIELGEDGCDGCGKPYKIGETIITNINSCCGGGCYRTLCANCIEEAYKLLKE